MNHLPKRRKGWFSLLVTQNHAPRTPEFYPARLSPGRSRNVVKDVKDGVNSRAPNLVRLLAFHLESHILPPRGPHSSLKRSFPLEKNATRLNRFTYLGLGPSAAVDASMDFWGHSTHGFCLFDMFYNRQKFASTLRTTYPRFRRTRC